MTARMSLSAMMFLLLATPTSGLAWSSKGTSSTLKPAFSRLPLNFSTASWVPSLMPSPSAAWPPESGDWVAILMVPLPWAWSGEAPGSRATASARLRTRTPRRCFEFMRASLIELSNQRFTRRQFIATAGGRSSPAPPGSAPRKRAAAARGSSAAPTAEMTATPSAPAADDLLHVVGRDPADAYQRNADLAAGVSAGDRVPPARSRPCCGWRTSSPRRRSRRRRPGPRAPGPRCGWRRPRIMPGRSSGRATRAGRSSWPRCTPSAPTARARSTRSFTMKVTPAAAQRARRRSASGSSRPDGHSFSRSWTSRQPPATAAARSSTRSRPRARCGPG